MLPFPPVHLQGSFLWMELHAVEGVVLGLERGDEVVALSVLSVAQHVEVRFQQRAV